MELAQLMYSGNLEAVRGFIESNPAIVNQPDDRGFTPLILATYLNKKDITELLLEKGAQINAQDAAGNTALMGVSFKGFADLANLLIKQGADFSIQNNEGETALSFAQKHNQSEIEAILKDAMKI